MAFVLVAGRNAGEGNLPLLPLYPLLHTVTCWLLVIIAVSSITEYPGGHTLNDIDIGTRAL